LCVAGTGPRPITDGSTPATAIARMRAFGFSPSSRARSSDMIRTAAAPTLSGLELPAVTVPPSGMKAGFSAASASRLVSRRLHVLDAACYLHVLAVGRHALRRLVDRLEAGAAQAVDRRPAHLDRQAGDQSRHAGNVVALLALLLDTAPVDVLDVARRDAGPLE